MEPETLSNSVDTESPVLGQMLKLEHEQVVFCQDEATGLKAIIGIHNTNLGPALGGTRMWVYDNELAAIQDVLRLSRGMTYKAAVSGLNLGGGKAVIIGDSRKIKNEALMRRFGKFVDSLSGKYITAEDVGMTTKDMEYISMETDHVAGIPESLGGSGDPSPVTAYGTYLGMKASAKEAYGSDILKGKKIVVQGAGNVGRYLIDHLADEGAEIMITDIFDDKIKLVTDKHPSIKVIGADEVFDVNAEIYAPCALGATVNDNSLGKMKFDIIAGAANNQLEDEEKHGKVLTEKGIIYAPDFVINAGGLINVHSELEGYNRSRAMGQCENIYNTTSRIIKTAKEQNIPTYKAANMIAEERVEKVGRIKLGL